MNELSIQGDSLETSLAKNDLYDIIGGLSDATVEMLCTAGESIPVISYFFKGRKALSSVKEAFFMEKVVEFLRTSSEIAPDKRQKLIDRINEDVKYKQKFGKFSLIALDRFEDSQKATFLGTAVKYLAEGQINYGFYQRFAFIIERLSIEDIYIFLRDDFLDADLYNFHDFESLGLIRTVFKFGGTRKRPTDAPLPERGLQPLLIEIWYRKFTHWGKVVKCILQDLPIEGAVSV